MMIVMQKNGIHNAKSQRIKCAKPWDIPKQTSHAAGEKSLPKPQLRSVKEGLNL